MKIYWNKESNSKNLIGQRVKELRTERQLSQKALAEQLQLAGYEFSDLTVLRIEQGTRFVVETQFSKLGNFQFDGFVRSHERNLDLIVRTSSQLDDDFCTQLINLFKNSLYNFDYKGSVKINQKESFINFYEAAPRKQGIYI